MSSSSFAGTTIVAGSLDRDAVLAIQARLNEEGCGPVAVDGEFGAETFAAVEHFQSRSFDIHGQPLTIDGKVGPSTWSVLFGDDTVPTVGDADNPSPLLKEVLDVAAGEVGTRESPPGSNRGAKVDEYIRTTGLNPTGAFPWCACFAYWCFDKAAKTLEMTNPCVKTGSVLDLWNRSRDLGTAKRVLAAEAQAQPSLVAPGMLFLLRTSGEAGHTGLIEQVHGNALTTIEGNTNDGGGREGIGVFRRVTRTIPQINLGFVRYGQ